MTKEEKELQDMKREAVHARTLTLARELGATVVFEDFRTGVFVAQIHPSTMAMMEGHIFAKAAEVMG